jgi:hypothetical protein
MDLLSSGRGMAPAFITVDARVVLFNWSFIDWLPPATAFGIAFAYGFLVDPNDYLLEIPWKFCLAARLPTNKHVCLF